MPVDLAPITGSESGSFAHHVICERHPAIIQDLQANYPYPRQQQAQLDELEHETLHGSITRLPDAARDREYWDASGDGFYGRRWTDVPFLWAESYFYRRVLQAVQYFEPGPWHRLDPFRAKKTSELHDQRVAALLEQLDATGPIADADAFALCLQSAVWGNKADLGFEMGLQAAGLTASHRPSTPAARRPHHRGLDLPHRAGPAVDHRHCRQRRTRAHLRPAAHRLPPA